MAKKDKDVLNKFGSDIKDIIISSNPKPKRDWFFVLSMFFVVLFILMTLNSALFFYWSHTDEPKGEGQLSPNGLSVLKGAEIDLRKEKVDHVWDFFRHKEEQLEKIQRSKFMEDPSLTGPELADESEDSMESEEVTEEEEGLTEELF